MTASPHIVNVSDSDFQFEVLAHSAQRPVVVEFWADWDLAGKGFSSRLESLIKASRGQFRLAKVDVDANPSLVAQYQVRTIPAVKAFRNGQMVAEFSGPRSERQLQEFLDSLAPEPDSLSVSKGEHLLAESQWRAAAEAFRHVLNEDPDNPQAILGLARSHLAQGQPENALPLLREFPASKEYSQAQQLIPLAEAMANADERDEDEDELAPIYTNALRLAGRGNLPSAVDGVFDVLRADKGYRGGEARKVAVALLHVLGDAHPLTREYRAELSSLLF